MVKLHEAMFDMKEQLQMMEARVTNIAREKERLERTLQAKTQYIRVSSQWAQPNTHPNILCCM